MIVGVTGHQDIGDAATVAWVRGELENQLCLHGATLGLSSLARGADQLFVDALRALAIPFEVVIPSAAYEETFPDESARSRYRMLLSLATRIHYLPYPRPSEEAFFAAGKWIVHHCDLLLAVWNGRPARGLGGTGDVVQVALDMRRTWVHVNPNKKSVWPGA